MTADELLAIAASVIESQWLQTIFWLIIANVLSGLAVALYTRTFNFAGLGEWLATRALPFILGDLTVQTLVLANLPEGATVTTVVSAAVHAMVCLALVGKILENLREIGLAVGVKLPIPAIIRDPHNSMGGTQPAPERVAPRTRKR